MILLIDNYDSFTFNLVHFLGDLGAECDVRRNDALSAEEAMALAPEAIVLSPGPCAPEQAGICLDLIAAAAGRVPLLGVCLGHQAIGQAFGAVVERAPVPDAREAERGGARGERRVRGAAVAVPGDAGTTRWWCARSRCRGCWRRRRTRATGW